MSDRMLTSGDIEYEAAQSKIYPLGELKALCLPAGDASFHVPIGVETSRRAVQDQLVNTGDIASLYAENYASLRRRRAERMYLAPYGLDTAAFLSRQRRMNETLVLSLADRMDQAELELDTIIVGVDSDGAHIYHVRDPGIVTCHDGTGFWAIGSGDRQFASQFMYQGYARSWPWLAALLLLYSAKKRAEVAPGVGRETDIFWMTRKGCQFFSEDIKQALAR
jgi:hypothetical protein